ncbi:MAG TPA: TA system VapC family ribonuclease toxin, partial [Candidatus Binataceae bacterium]|nr:TA system VapC family ribonuclease toxin [Candidatus Binataceae bacterium]
APGRRLKIVAALFDADVLVALFDSLHVHHRAAHAWLRTNRGSRWATCAMTENAFLRVLSNPGYPGSRTTIEDAASRLRELCSAPEHVFWTDSVSVRDCGRFRWRHVQGYRQIADVYLLALAVANQGRIATFDSAISIGAVQGAAAENLELIAV